MSVKYTVYATLPASEYMSKLIWWTWAACLKGWEDLHHILFASSYVGLVYFIFAAPYTS